MTLIATINTKKYRLMFSNPILLENNFSLQTLKLFIFNDKSFLRKKTRLVSVLVSVPGFQCEAVVRWVVSLLLGGGGARFWTLDVATVPRLKFCCCCDGAGEWNPPLVYSTLLKTSVL